MCFVKRRVAKLRLMHRDRQSEACLGLCTCCLGELYPEDYLLKRDGRPVHAECAGAVVFIRRESRNER